MHLIEPIRSCIDSILQSTGSGIKSMLLDDFTTGVINAGYSRSDMLLREVYLFERIDTIHETSERLNLTKCIVILRPTKSNVELLCQELNRPHYRTYHLYFTCRIGPTLMKRLAEADEVEVVRCISELPLDYQAVNPFLFTLKLIDRTFDLYNNNWLSDGIKRACDGLSSVLIALQVNPVIRYQTQSQLCKILAEKVGMTIKNEALANKPWRGAAPFDTNSLLLIIDRRSDLITPIINKWTYYAMIHEQFGIISNRISLINIPDRKPTDPKDMLISMESDQFFEENYYKNYGELGPILRDAVNSLKSNHKVETVEDMKRFVDEYPESRRFAANLHNHVFLMSELTRITTENNLMAVSECEQEMACGPNYSNDVIRKLKNLVASDSVRPLDAIRLVCLYAVTRNNDKSTLSDLKKLLKARSDVKHEELQLVEQLREFSLSKPQNPLDDTVQQVTKMIVQGVKGVDNVLLQHRPSLGKIIDELRRGNRLRESDFAFFGERYRDEPPRRVIVFIVGGATFDEALLADHINRNSDNQMQIIVGGTSIHNFSSFAQEVRSALRPEVGPSG